MEHRIHHGGGLPRKGKLLALMVWLDESRVTLGGGGGLGKGQRAEGVKWRGQKVTGWAEKISDVPGGAVTGWGRRCIAPSGGGLRGEG